MKTVIYFLFATAVTSVYGQVDKQESPREVPADTSKHRPFQASIMYPMGTNGVESPEYSNNFSFNLFYGLNGGVQGFELGAIVNSNTGNVLGAQIAGISNINAKNSHGFMAAGIANICRDSSGVLAVAGITNLIGGTAYGAQVAGIANTTNGNLYGGQASGISNIANGNVIGLQACGISNVANGNFIGLQVAGISNIAKGDFTGGQIGLFNRAGVVTGTQIGLINIASDYKYGVPIGLFSYVKNGYHAIELAGGEAVYANLNVKLGVRKLYTIYKAGWFQNGSEQYGSVGLGFGSLFDFGKRIGISTDLSGSNLFHQTYSPEFNVLIRHDIALRLALGKHFDVFIGPSANVYIAEHNIDTGEPALNIPYKMYSENWWNGEGSTSFWLGGNAGISFIF